MENLSKQANLRELSIELQKLLKDNNEQRMLKKGDFLFQEGMNATELFIVTQGKVQVSTVSAEGRELTLRICGENELIGELSLFTAAAKYLLNARAIETAEVTVIKKEQLEEQLMKNSALAFEFMKWMSDQFRRTQTKFRDLVLGGKKGAVYSTLIRMANSYGIEVSNGTLIDLTLTNQELANFAGSTRESVNRMLNDLKRNNIISTNKGKITIHDIKYLRNEINCAGCPTDLCSIE